MVQFKTKYTKLFIYILLLFIFLYGCNSSGEKERADLFEIETLVQDALNGNTDANEELSILFTVKHTSAKPNKVDIKNYFVDNRNYFYVLAEFPDPMLNIFAIYNSKLDQLLLDKSLNGNLTAEWVTIDDMNLILLQEKFLSKDVISLERISFYTIINSQAWFIFRTYTKIEKEGKLYNQTVTSVNRNFIITKIDSKEELPFKTKVDTFYFDSFNHMYKSKNDRFENFVIDEINSFNWIPIKPQIENTAIKNEPIIEQTGYSIELAEDWKTVINFNQKKYLSIPLTGNKYISSKLGANITVIQLPADVSTAKITDVEFGIPTTGDYKVRTTGMLPDENNLYKIEEHSCNNKTFLLIFECPKYTYDENKTEYENILNSFFINCN